MHHRTSCVRAKEVAELDLFRRVAWATSFYEKILALYSPYFRETFHQQEAVDLAWEFAAGHSVDEKERKNLITRIEGLTGKSGDEGYGEDSILPGALILSEIDCDDGRSSAYAVEYAVGDFVAMLYYWQGINPLDKYIRRQFPDYFRLLSLNAYQLSRQMYEEILSWPTSWLDRSKLEHFSLPLSFPPLEKEVRGSVTWLPPLHERKDNYGQSN